MTVHWCPPILLGGETDYTPRRAAGVGRAVLEIPDRSRDDILRVLDGYVPLLG